MNTNTISTNSLFNPLSPPVPLFPAGKTVGPESWVTVQFCHRDQSRASGTRRTVVSLSVTCGSSCHTNRWLKSGRSPPPPWETITTWHGRLQPHNDLCVWNTDTHKCTHYKQPVTFCDSIWQRWSSGVMPHWPPHGLTNQKLTVRRAVRAVGHCPERSLSYSWN